MEDVLARLDRVESMLAIQQLAVRYAVATDSRDFDTWVSLFVEDVHCGRRGVGRPVLKEFIEAMCREFYRSVHYVCGHKIEFQDADHATGNVYCRAEHETGDNWVTVAVLYFDTYERRDGVWYFVRRRELHWYAADQERRPAGPTFNDWPGVPFPNPALPALFPTWHEFWENGPGKETLSKVTAWPVERPGAKS